MIGNTMTAARHRRKFSGWCRTLLLVVLVGWAVAAAAATTEQLVADRNSGLAISGFDPVAYFINRAPLLGRESIEHAFAGAVWRFRNEGNRAVFIADPEVYMPRFGGYDPIGVARGVAVPGDPRLWLIEGERLYFFYTREARAAFAADSERLGAAAEKAWPAVLQTLAP